MYGPQNAVIQNVFRVRCITGSVTGLPLKISDLLIYVSRERLLHISKTQVAAYIVSAKKSFFRKLRNFPSLKLYNLSTLVFEICDSLSHHRRSTISSANRGLASGMSTDQSIKREKLYKIRTIELMITSIIPLTVM